MAFAWIRTRLFGRYLFITNSISFGSLMGAGDLAGQSIEGLLRGDKKIKYDWGRTGRMCCIGLFLQGPCNHAWYTMLDKMLPGKAKATVVKKILLDQTMAAPFFACSFFLGMGVVEQQPIENSISELKAKFWPVMKADWAVWPAAQAINFYLLPPQVRVIYVGFVTLCWNAFLSHMKHLESYEKSQSDAVL